MATGGSKGSGGAGGTRAIDAVASASSSFVPRGATLARTASARVVDRWAPERGAASRNRSLGAMAFADRLLTSYVSGPGSAGMSLSGTGLTYAEATTRERGFRSPPPTSWLFPSPWYQDEIDWLEAAQRAPYDDSPRGQVARAMSMPPRALPLVAPALAPGRPAPRSIASAAARAGGASFAGGRGSFGDGSAVVVAPTRRAAAIAAQTLRAWTPLVCFAAVQAAEVMAGALGATPELEADLERGGFHATDVPVMELISPADLATLAAEASPAPQRSASRARASRRAPAPQPMPAPSRARLEAARERLTRPAAPPVAAPAPAPAAPMRGARATDLLAVAALSAQTATAPASGPRVAMPAGLGGLIAGVTTSSVVRRPLVARQTPIGMTPAMPRLAAVPATGSAPVPRLPLAPPTPVYARSALSAIESTRPAALDHVGWADHWLARFAGASRPALAALDDAMGARSITAAQLAPEPVFLSPAALPRADRGGIDVGLPAATVATGTATAPVAPAAARPPAPRPEALRIDDDESVPDEIFEALARAAAAPPPRAPAAPVPPPAAPVAPAPAPVRARPSLADRVLAIPPVAPGAGLRAQLSASPAAAALAGTTELPAAPTFDVRTLEPGGVARAYLGGAILPLAVRVPEQVEPRVLRPLSLLAGRDLGLVARVSASLATAARAPMPVTSGLLRMLAARAPEVSFVAPPAYESVEAAGQRAAFDDLGAPIASRPMAPAPRTEGDAILPQTALPLLEVAASTPGAVAPAPGTAAPAPGTAAAPAPGTAAPGAPAWMAPSPFTASPMIALDLAQLSAGPAQATELPVLRPGAFGASAESWATDHLQEVADLSFDFVAPELILAAREYGFGPAEAARAMRMAAGGRHRLASMASAVDIAFVAALAGDEPVPLRAAAGAPAPSYVAGPLLDATPAAGAAPMVGEVAAVPGAATMMQASPAAAAFAEWQLAPTMLGGPPHLPRGVFLWPEAVAGAMELAEGEGDAHPLARAALDLLAASEVVHAGTITGAAATEALAFGGAVELVGATELERASLPAGAQMPPQFEAIFVALSASPEGRTLPPTVRAARALAMAVERVGGTTAPSSARERAAAAWAVMPTVITGGVAETQVARAGDADDSEPFSASRTRAGESLRSLVAPAAERAQPSAPAYSPAPGVHPGASMQRELVQTAPITAPAQARIEAQAQAMATQARARSEMTDLPPWLEEAARSMLEAGSDGDGMTFAEMTLVTSAPARQVAASPQSADSPVSQARPADEHKQHGEGKHDDPDVGRLARKVFEELERMLAIARERSGDPWRV